MQHTLSSLAPLLSIHILFILESLFLLTCYYSNLREIVVLHCVKNKRHLRGKRNVARLYNSRPRSPLCLCLSVSVRLSVCLCFSLCLSLSLPLRLSVYLFICLYAPVSDTSHLNQCIYIYSFVREQMREWMSTCVYMRTCARLPTSV